MEVKESNGSTTETAQFSLYNSGKVILLTGPLNILLPCIPIALISFGAAWPDGVTFVFSLLALAPLAERLGFVTEQLALHTNETIGGLLNATFGNATELIVAITALAKGLFKLVQLSLLGSILSNMLLVLGMSFFFGGLRYKVQTFGKISSQINSTLLMLSTMGILLPTVLYQSGEASNLSDNGFSRATSLVLFVIYFIFLYFQLKSHKYLYEDGEEEDIVDEVLAGQGSGKRTSRPSSSGKDLEIGLLSASAVNFDAPAVPKDSVQNPMLVDGAVGGAAKSADTAGEQGGADDDEEEDQLGYYYSLVWLAIITVFIAFLSEAISSSIEDAASSAGISGIFLAAIVLPIVGNAAEHAGAVMFAWKDKLDLSLGVAIGSSTQIALLVLPLLVLLGWMMGKDMNLNFGAYESATLFLSVVSVTFAIKDGTSNWLLGVTLCFMYIVIAAGFWAHNNDSLSS